MHPYALQDRCSERLRGIEIPRPFSIDVFAAAVAERRGRALRILPLPGLDGSDGLSGAWVATDTTDYVLIDADASPWHRDMIGLHEIGHVLCGHGTEHGGPRDRAGDPLPGLSDVTIRRALGRDCYSSRDEQEAELMACLVLGRADADPLPASPSSGPAGIARQAQADLVSLRALRAMWLELATAVPGVAASLSKRWTADPARDSRIRLIRRTAEIRDAALALRSYVPPSTAAQARRQLTAQGLAETAFDAAGEACWLELAVRAARAGMPGGKPAHMLPGGSTLQEEVRWLRRVAVAMRSARVQAVAAELAEQQLRQPGK